MTRIVNLSVPTLFVIGVLAVTIIVAMSTGILNESHAQKLTPEQKAAFCNPNNPRLKFVNSTESAICGIPTTPSNTTTSSPLPSSTTQPPPSTTLTPSAP